MVTESQRLYWQSRGERFAHLTPEGARTQYTHTMKNFVGTCYGSAADLKVAAAKILAQNGVENPTPNDWCTAADMADADAYREEEYAAGLG